MILQKKNGHNNEHNLDNISVDILAHREKEKSRRFSFLKKFFQIFSVSAMIGIATFVWTIKTSNDATQQYNAQLVKDYIESVKTLILDDYHHGKDAKYPAISVEEIEAFVRAKTGNTLKALDEPTPQNWIQEYITFPLGKTFQYLFFSQPVEKQNLINFLTEAGIGFFPPSQVETTFNNNYIQNVCPKNDALGYLPKSHPKDYTFHHFFCGINLQGVDLSNVDLNRVILENANLQGATLIEAKLWQADLQGEKTNLNNVDLSNADLKRANLKGVTMTGATLDNAKLNQANLRGAWLWMAVPDFQEKIQKTSLKEADLTGANLQDTKLRGVDLSNANMSFFELQYNYKGDKIKRKISTNLRGSDLKNADLRGTDLRNANLRGADLTNAKILTNADMGWTLKMQKTNLVKALYDKYTELPFSGDSKAQEKRAKYEKMSKIWWGSDDLPKLDLSNVDLRLAFRCRNDKGQFMKCEVPKQVVNFSGTNLTRADLRGADLSKAEIDGDTKLKGALYDDETLLSHKLQERKGEMIELKKVDLNEDQQVDCKKIKKADLRKKDLSYLDLSGVDLSCTQLQDSELTSIDFDENTKFTNAEYDQHTKLPFNHDTALRYGMRYAPHGEKSDNSPINWPQEDHQQADLRKAILNKANFKGTIFTEARFQDANLTDAHLENADLTKANLWKADLTGAILTGTNLTDANLTGANLTGANLTGANLTGANLTGVDLQKVTNLKDATLCRATLPPNPDRRLFERTKTDCPEPKPTSNN